MDQVARPRGWAPRALARRLGPLVAVAAVAACVAVTLWSPTPHWTPDSLFYEAQARELAGTPAKQARHEVFSGGLGVAAGLRAEGRDESWVEASAPFYRRRWVVPALDAALKPAFGERALSVVSLVGFVAAALAIYLLVASRFSTRTALVVAGVAIWFPPLRYWAGFPLTDTLGVAAIGAMLAIGAWATRGSAFRLLGWAAAVLLLSFTRDAAVLAVASAICLVAYRRSGRAIALATTALASAASAPALFAAPLRETMAFTFNGNRVPSDPSWDFVRAQYLEHVERMWRSEFPVNSRPGAASLLLVTVALGVYVRRANAVPRFVAILTAVLTAVLVFLVLVVPRLDLPAFPEPVPAGLLLLAGLIPLFAVPARDDLAVLVRGGAAGALVLLALLPQFTHGRLTLVLAPFALFGLARLLEPAEGSRTRQRSGAQQR
jgi:hypothetical protein